MSGAPAPSPTPVTSTTGSVVTGDQLNNAGPEFTSGTPTMQGNSSSGYGNYQSKGTQTASPWVNVIGSVTKGYGSSSYKETGIVSMTSDAAYNSFIKGLYTKSPDVLALIDQMNKMGINTKNMSNGEIAAIYKNALDDTAQAIQSGASNYNVIQSLADMGKTGKYAGASGQATSSTQIRYDRKIYSQEEFAPIANQVAQSLLGRMMSEDEIKRALAEVNKQSKANPQKTVTKTRYNAAGTSTKTSSTTTGGINAQDVLQSSLGETAESQAYTTNNVFNDAMRVLANRIG